MSPLALKPGRGGPKNLPILERYLGDFEDDANTQLVEKPHLVIVGGGWGAVGVLNSLHPGDYHVTVISPETYTTFTPLLPCTSSRISMFHEGSFHGYMQLLPSVLFRSGHWWNPYERSSLGYVAIS